MKITLDRESWEFDETKPLGREGGFGAVFLGSSGKYGDVAIKRLKLSAASIAHREMHMANELAGKHFNNVMPVLDAGEDKQLGQYFVVMPKADKCLQDELDATSKLDERTAAEVLLQIAEGLAEVPGIVHRDLKPANVLLHEQNWKIADFGIARFVEEATSLMTLKDCLSPPYAAPEQWNNERATTATDVYALGCIAYALLTGSPPFTGLLPSDFKEQHLHGTPALMQGVSPRLQNLIRSTLRKSQGSRITLRRFIDQISSIVDGSGKQLAGGIMLLAGVANNVAMNELAIEAHTSKLEAKQKERHELCNEGDAVLQEIVDNLANCIELAAPNARRKGNRLLILGGAELGIVPCKRVDAKSFPQSKWDVLLVSRMRVTQELPPYSWSSSLWYAKPPDAEQYRWYEMFYWSPGADNPVDLSESLKHADEVWSKVFGRFSAAFGPVCIDEDQVDEFIERWCYIFAQAAQSQLKTKSGNMPLLKNFWRS